MKTLLTAVAFITLASPAFAASCWQNEGGDRLTNTGTDASALTLAHKGGQVETCTSAQSESGPDIACGDAAKGDAVIRIAAKPGYVAKDILVWRGEPWFACK